MTADKQPLIIFALGCIGAMGVGLIRLDNPSSTWIIRPPGIHIHRYGSHRGRKMAKHPLDKVSILAGIIGIIFVALMVLVDAGSLEVSGSIGHGRTERIIAYPALIWMVVLRGNLIASPDLKGNL
jgi:hypothetical protein